MALTQIKKKTYVFKRKPFQFSPTPQNGQTHTLAIADELFECL